MRAFSFTLAFILFQARCVAQQEQMAIVDSLVQAINTQLSSYLQTIKAPASSDEDMYVSGGRKIIYTDGDDVVLIKVKGIYSAIEKSVSWYYNNRMPVYCDQQWRDIETGHITDHQRFYLHNEELIAWLDTENSPVPKSSALFKEMSTSLPAYAKELISIKH